MTIGALCTRKVATVRRDATVAQAAASMRAYHVGDLLVTDPADDRIPIGIITDRDIVLEVVGQGMAPADVPVGAVMSAPLVSLREEDGVLEALSIMAARGVRRAPVLDRGGRLAGVLSIDDLLALLVRELS